MSYEILWSSVEVIPTGIATQIDSNNAIAETSKVEAKDSYLGLDLAVPALAIFAIAAFGCGWFGKDATRKPAKSRTERRLARQAEADRRSGQVKLRAEYWSETS